LTLHLDLSHHLAERREWRCFHLFTPLSPSLRSWTPPSPTMV
jgi:hypothetical protein